MTNTNFQFLAEWKDMFQRAKKAELDLQQKGGQFLESQFCHKLFTFG